MEVNSGDIVINALTVFGFSKFYRVYFETELNFKKEDLFLKYAWVGTTAIGMLLGFWGDKNKYGEPIINNLLFAFFCFVTYQINNKSKSRNFLIAALPVFILGNLVLNLKGLSNFLFDNYYEYLASINDFAMFWLIGFSIFVYNQTKKDRLERQKEQEMRRILEEQKSTLEYQVAERTAEITKQKNELEQTIEVLKTTQSQLVHSEKMASLGELTAGIAHEIQNPLNFVNNFSEVSAELCEELNEYIDNETFDKSYVKELLSDLTQNQQKITHHGQRASSIVKGMLQHSRTSTSEKELTDINALADEYLRLSYHGLRAKDKTFNADFKTNLDPNLPKINVVAQDIGRVLLNLINNAFYAVKSVKNPHVQLNTTHTKNNIIVKITDNGIGMPEATKAKIFQPFFTTKPTGEGTGLGLSLAFDIIAKGHAGTIEVESEEGKGTTFIVKLPI